MTAAKERFSLKIPGLLVHLFEVCYRSQCGVFIVVLIVAK